MGGPMPKLVSSEAHELIRLHEIHQERIGNLPRSIVKRGIYLRALARWLEPRGLLEATRKDIELFLDGRKTHQRRKIASSTRYYWIAHFHSFYRWAMLEELTLSDPTATIIRPRQRRTLPRPIDIDDLVTAIRAARPQMRAMVSVAAYGGLRCQEIAGLDRDDIIEAKGLIRVRMGKGAKERIIPLHPEVLEALRCLPMPRSGALFVRPRGGRHLPSTVSLAVNRYLRELGINATTHQFRHWFGSEIYANTHDIRVTQELLGHANPATTAGYIAYSHVDAANAVASLSITPKSLSDDLPPPAVSTVVDKLAELEQGSDDDGEELPGVA
jgi:integrase/recombinase XerC